MNSRSIINFRYAVERKLGEGMSGEVFQVCDLLTDRRNLAMKVLRTPEPSSRSEELFRAEVSTLLNLHHPNLIRLFDFGTIRHCTEESYSSRRFFTMEYLNGTDSLQWLSGVRGQGIRDDVLLDLLFQSLMVLAYIHQMDVIHFDIKPQNLIVMEEPGQEGVPVLKLVDFGLSEAASASPGSSLRGTPEYSAPEILRGEEFDHRIDLYSLGCSFFHLIEGRSPFEGPDIVQIVKNVLGTEAGLSAPGTEAGAILHEVVSRLMSKDPLERFASAYEAASVLLDRSPSPHGGRRQQLLGKPRFVGRNDERGFAGKAIERLLRRETGPPAIVLVGDEGIGKSALLRELLGDARAKDIRVFEADSNPSPLPFNAVNRILAELSCEAKSISAEGRKIVNSFKSSLERQQSGESPASTDEEQRDQETQIELKARFIGRCGRLFPFVIAADNLRLLDQQSVAVLKTVIRELDPARILLLATDSAASETLPENDLHIILHLRELDPVDLSAMYRSVFGTGPGMETISKELYRLYGGSPAPIIEAFQALTGMISWNDLNNKERINEITASLEQVLPANLEEFLRGRYNSMKPEERLLLEMLARFNGPARFEVLAELLPFHQKRIEHSLQRLESRELISATENNRRFFIRSQKLQGILPPFDPPEERQLRFMIAASLAISSNLTLGDLEELGHQFGAAGSHADESIYFEKAAEAAGAVSAYHHALHLSRKSDAAAELSKDPARVTQSKKKLAGAYFHCGQHSEAIECGRQVLRNHDPGSETARAGLYKLIGCSESRLGHYEQAKSDLSEALRMAHDDLDRIELRQELAGIEISVGHFRDAELTCLEQLDNAKVLEKESLVAAIYTDLGISTFLQGRYDDSIAYFRESKNRYEGVNQPSRVADAMNNIANALSAKGTVDEAIEYWTEALAMSEAHATLNRQAEILNNLGIAHYNIRRYEEALGYYREARSIFVRIGSRNGEAYTLTNLGEVALAEVEYENALDLWSEALALYQSMGDLHGLCETDIQIAQVSLILGDYEAAADHLKAAKGVIDAESLVAFLGEWNYQSGMRELCRGDLSAALGYFVAARAQFAADARQNKITLCDLRIARCRHEAGINEPVAPLLLEILNMEEASRTGHSAGEASLLLAIVARGSDGKDLEAPTVYLRKGLDVVSQEPVAEISWKLAYALGTGLLSRGQVHQANESFRKAVIVLSYILSKFRSDELRERYISTDGRKEALAEIRRQTGTRGKS